jgi:hypothetical protein
LAISLGSGSKAKRKRIICSIPKKSLDMILINLYNIFSKVVKQTNFSGEKND